MTRLPAILLVVCLSSASAMHAAEDAFSKADYDYFERKIRPLLVKRCYSCHSEDAKTVYGGLKLDSAGGIERGGDSGPLLAAGKPATSLLMEVIGYEGDTQMPPKGKMPAAEIAELTAWVKRGAPVPPDAEGTARTAAEIDFEAGRQFWSFQPVREQTVPAVKNRDWLRTRIDSFVLAAMEREGLDPSPQADRKTLIRRLTFDLIGLPPTPEEVREFVGNDSPNAVAQLVERLLESPQYGERWGRHWLDMARYTDKTATWLYDSDNSHRYRDWVVQAFNDDMPYDEFVHRQLATDLMPETGPEDLAALGFLSLSPTYWKELKLPCEIIKVIVADEWEERIDAVSRTFLGLSVACARCHDHKFDPISSADYYALAGVFASSRQVERPLIPAAEYAVVEQAKKQVAALEADIAKLKKAKPEPADKVKELTERVAKLRASTPHFDAPMASAIAEQSLYVVRAGKTAQDGTRLDYRDGARDLPLFVRGNPNRPGPIVPRRFLTVLSGDSPQPFQHGSGRFELARAITTDAASLTARVIVNRVWLAHFGRGLVNTPSDFGVQGERPSHPELLDDLAARFIASGWSIKSLHREILLSAAWQQSSQTRPPQLAADPANRWLSRMNRRRLEFEAWRDAMLSCSGTLDPATGGPSVALEAVGNRRRTIYSTVHRRDMSTTLQIHDFPDPTQHSPRRNSTMTALQGLYALNGPLLSTQAAALAERLAKDTADVDAKDVGEDDPKDTAEVDAQNNAARIERAYWLLFSRAPTARERQLGSFFLSAGTSSERAARWQQYAHALLASNEFLFVD